MSNHVLEYVDDFCQVLREKYRVYRKDESLILSFSMDKKVELLDGNSTETSDEERNFLYWQNDHK